MPTIDVTVAVTCHREGIVLHKTLLSIKRSIDFVRLNIPDLTIEVIVHADNPTTELKKYLNRLPEYFPGYTIYTNTFGGPGRSRRFCIDKANGTYISLIDGDDLMSKNWILEAYKTLESKPNKNYVAHSDMTVEFGDMSAIVQKYGETNRSTDSLLSVWSGRWNAIIFGPTEIFKKIGYPVDEPGYGFEDWLFSCMLIYESVRNITIPETTMFVRRKSHGSVWDSHREQKTLLKSNPLLCFKHIRSLEIEKPNTSKLISKPGIKNQLKLIAKRYGLGRRAFSLYQQLALQGRPQKVSQLPDWLVNEWRDINSIDKNLFPDKELIVSVQKYKSLTDTHYQTGFAYKKLVDITKHDYYDYIIFVPWMIKGGADLFAINYARTIQKLRPSKRVLVLATLPSQSVWANKLGNIDFVDFGNITSNLAAEQIDRLMEQFIENSGASYLHIINSALAYDFVLKHENYIINTGKKIVATSFSQSINKVGKIFGYSHTHVPAIYELLSAVTTDNIAVANMWRDEYGFDTKLIKVHRQPVDLDLQKQKNLAKQKHSHSNTKLKVLWAARLAPEKLAYMIPSIGRLLQPNDITIDMYGQIDPGYDTNFLSRLPQNVKYHGPYDGFAAIPTHKYDIYLYTSAFDGTPNVLFEATQAALPIVASNVGGIPELLNNSCGLLVQDIYNAEEYAQQILELTDQDLRLRTVQNAADIIGRMHAQESYVEAISKMLEQIGY